MRKFIVIFLSLLCILSLCACAEETPEPTELDISAVTFTQEQVRLGESEYTDGAAYGLLKNMDVTVRGNVSFAFEPSISMETRAKCIQTTEQLLFRLNADTPLKLNIYTQRTYGATFVESGAVYTCEQDWLSPEYTATVLLGIYGEYCNFGAVTGYANYLAADMTGLAVPKWENEPALSGDLAYLDLNLLCFRTEFVSVEEAEQAKLTANTFVDTYIREHGEEAFRELLKHSGDPETVRLFRDALDGFYSQNGISHTPSEILYRHGGKGYDYIVKSPYAQMYVEINWSDVNRDLCPYTYENFLHENYRDVRQYFTVTSGEFQAFQQLFDLGPYTSPDVHYTNQHANTSFYNAPLNTIHLLNTASLSHEYIHALTYERCIQELWAGEGLAEYFDSYYNYYGNAMSNVDYNTVDMKCIQEFRENLGRDIDFATDYREIWHILTYANSLDHPNDGNGYIPGASFIDYLVRRFGEEKTIEIICVTHDFGEFTFEELVADWQAFIQENYSGYTKRK